MKIIDTKTIEKKLTENLSDKFANKKVLVLIPDSTRSLPLPKLFRSLVWALENTKQLDFMVALGTHPPMSIIERNKLVGITEEEKKNNYSNIGIFNHEYDLPDSLIQIGNFDKNEIKKFTDNYWHPSLPENVPIKINHKIYDYDELLILGPTFPHEVVGFSGGAKYLFPGISGPEMIHATHWLGALNGLQDTIGKKNTPIRKMIHAAASKISLPITLISLVVHNDDLAGMFIGDYLSAWESASKLSSDLHIIKYSKPFKRVLSKAPEMYDDLWTAGKAMYKLDSVVEDGGDLIIYAPHMKEISKTHRNDIFNIGYHVIDYFLNQWDEFKSIPLSVIAHSTHVKGAGSYINGVETPRINVYLSSQVSEEDCKRLNLGYIDPASINESFWQNKEEEGILFVPKAGEMLYRLSD